METNYRGARLGRWRRKQRIIFGDVRRAWQWHILGGSRFFPRHFKAITKAHSWCFIVGCNNSGTTLLHDLLSGAPNVSILPNEGQMYTNVLVRGERRGFERVWSEFVDELRLDETSSKQSAPRLVHDWMTEYGLDPGRWLLEKSTVNAVRMRWLETIFPHAHFIAVIRNGYAVAEGIKRKGGKEVGRAARHWNAVNRIIIEDAPRLKKLLLVRYEDLSSDLSGTLRRIEQFLGWDEGSVETKISLSDHNLGSLERLGRSEIETIRSEAAEMLAMFNYGAEVPGSPKDGAGEDSAREVGWWGSPPVGSSILTIPRK